MKVEICHICNGKGYQLIEIDADKRWCNSIVTPDYVYNNDKLYMRIDCDCFIGKKIVLEIGVKNE